MDITKSKAIVIGQEIKSDKVETSFNVRWEVILFHHRTGKKLRDNFDNLAEAIPTLERESGMSDRSLYRAAKFYKDWPDLSMLPVGKNVSMNSITKKYLKEPGEQEEEKCYHCLIHCPKL